ncbi:MAG: DNA gyrase subunit A [Thermaerobacter sp.]|nr:DNA gyrase subunit A [Thermaerobacter sp.]
MSQGIGNVLPVELSQEMRRSYIDYAMSVIVARALPDARDGLKPVHRRVLFAMHEAGNTPDKPYKKSARVVGDVLGRYHPHGDMAVYDAMVRLAQDFSMRMLLVDGHGNFGSVDGDPPAASRYTEVRMTRLAQELLRDLDKETVDFRPNFSEEFEEPVVLPARYPNLLVNGSSGIAVGMATNIPPHNLGEAIDGVIYLIEHPEATNRDLMELIKGPDFPTGALILGHQGIRSMYETGRGAIIQRAVAEIEVHQGKSRIVVTELPYQVNKARLIERIADLVRDKKIDGITDLRDESDRTGMRIAIEVRRDQNPKVLLNQLYKHTPLQQSFGAIMLALVDGQPRLMRLRDMLEVYLRHQREVVTRRSAFELRKAEERAHILEGLRIALDNLDAVISLIRASRDAESARNGLTEQFGLSERQAQAILDLRLQRLTQLERAKIDEEFEGLQQTIAYLKALLSSEEMLLGVIKQELAEIRRKYADERRSHIVQDSAELDDEDLIADEPCVVTLTHQGYVKRQPVDVYRAQRRGGRGITGTGTKAEDFVEKLFATRTHHWVLFFTDRGRVYRIKVHEVPEAGRTARGTAAVNLVNLMSDEQITATITLSGKHDEGYLFMATRLGVVKKTPISEYLSIRASGLIALSLDDGDSLIGVHNTTGTEEIILVTRNGMATRFREEDVRPMGRGARGVRGIRLERGNYVIGVAVAHENSDLVIVTNRGMGKRTSFEQFRAIGRGGKGVHAISLTSRNGYVAAVRAVELDDHLMLISAQGVIIRMTAADVPRYGRASQGVQMMRLSAEDELVSMARVSAAEEALIGEVEDTDDAEE